MSGVSAGEYVSMMQSLGYTCHVILPDRELGDTVPAVERFDLVNVAFMPCEMR